MRWTCQRVGGARGWRGQKYEEKDEEGVWVVVVNMVVVVDLVVVMRGSFSKLVMVKVVDAPLSL